MKKYNGKTVSIDGAGYYRLYMPNHPSAHKDGFVHIHTLQAEKLLKRHLKDDE